MKIFLTGATGFIGRELIHQQKADYRCVIRSKDISLKDAIVADISSAIDWTEHLDSCDAIIHLAGLAHNKAKSAAELSAVNRDATIKLARDAALAGVKRFVFVSSIGVNVTSTYGEPVGSDSRCSPQSDYAISKYEAEKALIDISRDTGLEVVIVRPTLVYGLHAQGNFGLLKSLVEKLPILPFGCANNRRDFISVQNLADLLFCCATHPKAANQIYIAAENETVSTRQFTNAIAVGLNKKVLQIPVPVAVFRMFGKLVGRSVMIEQLFGDLQVDTSTLTSELGWRAPFSMAESMTNLNENKQ